MGALLSSRVWLWRGGSKAGTDLAVRDDDKVDCHLVRVLLDLRPVLGTDQRQDLLLEVFAGLAQQRRDPRARRIGHPIFFPAAGVLAALAAHPAARAEPCVDGRWLAALWVAAERQVRDGVRLADLSVHVTAEDARVELPGRRGVHVQRQPDGLQYGVGQLAEGRGVERRVSQGGGLAVGAAEGEVARALQHVGDHELGHVCGVVLVHGLVQLGPDVVDLEHVAHHLHLEADLAGGLAEGRE